MIKIATDLMKISKNFIDNILIPECERLNRDLYIALKTYHNAYYEHKKVNGSYKNSINYFDDMEERTNYQMSRVYDYIYFNEWC